MVGMRLTAPTHSRRGGQLIHGTQTEGESATTGTPKEPTRTRGTQSNSTDTRISHSAYANPGTVFCSPRTPETWGGGGFLARPTTTTTTTTTHTKDVHNRHGNRAERNKAARTDNPLVPRLLAPDFSPTALSPPTPKPGHLETPPAPFSPLACFRESSMAMWIVSCPLACFRASQSGSNATHEQMFSWAPLRVCSTAPSSRSDTYAEPESSQWAIKAPSLLIAIWLMSSVEPSYFPNLYYLRFD